MKHVYGFIDLYDAPDLGALTEKRNFGAVTFLGRYGLIDFALSNYTNSGIDDVGIVLGRYPTSIRNHIQSGQAFTINTRIGSTSVLYNENPLMRPELNTNVANIRANLRACFEYKDINYVVFAPANLLMSIDFTRVIDDFIESGVDICAIYQHRTDLDNNFIGQYSLKIKDGEVVSSKINRGHDKEGDIGLNTYIMTKAFLLELLEAQSAINPKLGFTQLVYSYYKKKKFAFGAYEFPKPVFPINSLNDYIKVSFDMLDYANRQVLFHENWPIYTTTHNTPPAIYGSNSDVKKSFVANGAIIDGKVYNSIISRDVVVEKGATVKNSILFTDTTVGKGVTLQYVLTDKYVTVTQTKQLKGDEKKFVVVRQGEKL